MTKAELISAVAEKGYSKKEAEKIIFDVFDTISETLEKGEKVVVAHFGVFSVRQRAERTVYNPKKGANIVSKAKKTPIFKAGKTLKAKVDKD